MPTIPVQPPPDGHAGACLPQHARDSKEFDAVQLFAGAREIVIRHEGERYRLRRTSKGKLILTK